MYVLVVKTYSVRVSNELGSGHPRAAKYAVMVTVTESLVMGIISMCIVMMTKNHFAAIFTNSKEMQTAVSHLAYLLSITLVLNSVQPVISGVAVGGGWQGLVAYINLFCYYIVGLPLGFFLGYKTHLGVEGIWIGMICGTTLQTFILVPLPHPLPESSSSVFTAPPPPSRRRSANRHPHPTIVCRLRLSPPSSPSPATRPTSASPMILLRPASDSPMILLRSASASPMILLRLTGGVSTGSGEGLTGSSKVGFVAVCSTE
ncbi:Multi antimicrobial extrusion protein, partial [Cynara cardunculus var. scolymus]